MGETFAVSTVPASHRPPSPTIHPLTPWNLERLQDDFGRENLLCRFSEIDGGRLLLKSESIEKWLTGVVAHQPLDFGPINATVDRRTSISGRPWSIPTIFRTYTRLKAIAQIPIADKERSFCTQGFRLMLWEAQSDIHVDTLDDYLLALEQKGRDELREFLVSPMAKHATVRELEMAYAALREEEKCVGVGGERKTRAAVITSDSSHGLFVRAPAPSTQGTIPMSISRPSPDWEDAEAMKFATAPPTALSAETRKDSNEGTTGAERDITIRMGAMRLRLRRKSQSPS
ncbi:hypothetical protein V8F20_009366 [Naviculisporaceae sp. PSN 640]